MTDKEKKVLKSFNKNLNNYLEGKYDENKFLLYETELYVTKKLTFSITKTQMRNVFDLIKNCKDADELKMTKPRLMYTAGRLSGSGKYFLLELSKQVTKIKSEKQMEAMNKFIETVLAYHKYHANN